MAQQAPGGGVGSKGFSPPVHGGSTGAPVRPPEPPALPGAVAKPGETTAGIAPDLPPTEALFDAINRGDVTEARDALARGADINGHNVLGMTPVDLSIDLSRNDITFLLLSMRSQADISGPPPNVAAGLDRRHKPGSKLATTSGTRLPSAQTSSIGVRSPAALPQVRYAGSGGTPIPQAGFLGFGGSGQP